MTPAPRRRKCRTTFESRHLAGAGARNDALMTCANAITVSAYQGALVQPTLESARDRSAGQFSRSAGLRPASRGSAKPAPMTLRHARRSVSPAPPSSPEGGDGDRSADPSRGSAKPASAAVPHHPLIPKGATQERRSPTGIARERETSTDDPAPCRRKSRTTLESRRARPRSAGLRPASRGSAKPAPMTLRHAAVSPAPPSSPGGRDPGAPVSDRHRAGARNQRR